MGEITPHFQAANGIAIFFVNPSNYSESLPLLLAMKYQSFGSLNTFQKTDLFNLKTQLRVRWSLSNMAKSLLLCYALRFRVGAIERIALSDSWTTKISYRSEKSLLNTHQTFHPPFPAALNLSNIRTNQQHAGNGRQ